MTRFNDNTISDVNAYEFTFEGVGNGAVNMAPGKLVSADKCSALKACPVCIGISVFLNVCAHVYWPTSDAVHWLVQRTRPVTEKSIDRKGITTVNKRRSYFWHLVAVGRKTNIDYSPTMESWLLFSNFVHNGK